MKNSVPVEMEESAIRRRILDAATELVANGGVAALTTRAVAGAASVQAPTLYRLFGDKRGLLDAVAEYGLAAFMANKVAAAPDPDPVQEVRDAWDTYVQFCLGHPAVFAIIHEVGRIGPPSPAATAGLGKLQARIRRIAQAGRLRVPEQRAVELIHAAGTGVIATQLAKPESERDPALSASARDAILDAVLTDAPDVAPDSGASFAVSLRAHLDAVDVLSPGEALLMREMLDRIARRPT